MVSVDVKHNVYLLRHTLGDTGVYRHERKELECSSSPRWRRSCIVMRPTSTVLVMNAAVFPSSCLHPQSLVVVRSAVAWPHVLSACRMGVTRLYDVSHCLLLVHTPSSDFPHLPPRKDVVNQCLEFVSGLLGHRVCARFSFRFMMMCDLMSSDVGLTY